MINHDDEAAEAGRARSAPEVRNPNGSPSADVFAQLATELHNVDGVEETVDAVVQFALQAVGCKYAAVALIAHGRQPEVVALTHPLLAEFFQDQFDASTGPMIMAVDTGQLVLMRDTLSETRWSSTGVSQMTAVGIRTAAYLPLLLISGRAKAVLSLYSDQPDAFTDDDLAVAHILAGHASVAIASARNEAELTQAVDARRIVGQAMGILMERYDLDSDPAFEVLKRYSQDNNRKLRDVAQELIDTRKLPN